MSQAVHHPNESDKIKKMVLAALFAALIAVGAYIKIPVAPVPISLQTFFILLAIMTLGRNWGTVSVIVYLLVGFIGFPVFAGGNSGLGIIFGPTGGYLYAFIIVAFLIGGLSEKIQKKSMLNVFLLSAFGSLLILFIGTLHLSASGQIPLSVAFVGGFAPFILGDLLKSIAVGLIAPHLIAKINFNPEA